MDRRNTSPNQLAEMWEVVRSNFLKPRTWVNPVALITPELTERPAIGDDIRGMIFREEGSTGVADAFITLMKDDTDTLGYANVLTSSASNQPFTKVFNVKHYGAKGDGTTDDTTPIRAAITAAETAGAGTVYFPAGTYPNAGLPPGSNITLLGDGPGVSIIKLRNNDGGTVISFDADQENIAVMHLTIDGNRDNQVSVGTAGHGVRLWGTYNAIMYNVEIKECWSYGIGTGYSASNRPVRRSLFDHIYIHDCGHVTGTTGSGDAFDAKRLSDSTISNVYIADIHNVGIDCRTNRNVLENIWIFRTGSDAASTQGHGMGIGRQLDDDPGDIPVDQRHGWALMNNIYLIDCGQGNGTGNALGFGADNAEVYGFDCRVEGNNIHISNPGGHGVLFTNDLVGDGQYDFTNLRIEGAGGHGLALTTTVDGEAQFHEDIHIKIANSIITGCAEDGIHDESGAVGEGVQLTAVDLIDNGGYGFYSKSPHATIIGGKASGNVLGDYFFDEQAFDSQITGGRVEEVATGRVGVKIAANRVNITGLQASGAGTGVELTSTSNGSLITNNSLIRCTTPITNNGINSEIAFNPGVADVAASRGPLFSPEVLIRNRSDAWFRFDRLGLANDAAVSSVSDWAASNRTFDQATGANQPLFKTNVQNGLSAILFDGSNDHLTLLNSILGAHPFCIAFVAKEEGAGYYLGSTQARVRTFGTNDFDAGMLTGPGAAVRYSAVGALNPRAWHVHVVAFNGASSFGSLDGARISSLNPGTAGAALSANITLGALSGASGFMNVYFGELVILGYLPSDADVARLEGALAHKWGITLTGGHTYLATAPW